MNDVGCIGVCRFGSDTSLHSQHPEQGTSLTSLTSRTVKPRMAMAVDDKKTVSVPNSR